MKSLVDNSLKAIIGMIAFATMLVLAPQRASAQSLSAPILDKEMPVTEFNAVNASDDFEVTLSRGMYGVRLTVDKDLAPYVEVYVKSKTLYLSYNEKSVPKEIRKLYKGKKGLVPIFRVVAYTPEIQSVSLSDNAVFTSLDEFTTAQFELSATGKSLVKNISVNASSAKISLRKNAMATVSLRTDRGVEASLDNNANLKLTFTGNELAVNADGSSVMVADGPCRSVNISSAGSSQVSLVSDTDKVDLSTEGSSKVSLSGKALSMTVKGTRNSTVDAFALPVEQVDANLSGNANVSVSVSKLVSATLVGGSALYYSGSPEFRINKIVKSTLAPYGTK